MANIIKALIVPAEEFLELQEKYAENKAAERRAARQAERQAILLQYTDELSPYNYVDLDDKQFQLLVDQLRTAQDKRIADEKAAEEAEHLERERIAKQEAEAAEAKRIEEERILKENERLRAAEAEHLRIQEIADSFAQFYSDDPEFGQEQARQALADIDTEINALAESDAANDQVIHAILNVQDKINGRLERLKLQAQRDEERRKREAAEAEQKAREEDEAKAKAEESEAARQAALAPDKEKLTAVLQKLSQPIELELSTDQGRQVLKRINDHRAAYTATYKEAIDSL
jgi:hypothetical protein